MTLQSSGTISFSQIENEFGQNNGRDMGEYRVSQTVGNMSNLPLDAGIPQSGQIRFSDFYGKELNVVISYSFSQNNPPSGSFKFDTNNGKTIVGGFKDASSVTSSQGTRVTLHVHSGVFLGSQQGNSTSQDSKYKSALTTGNGWETDTELDINIAGVVCGGGGNGGQGSEDPDRTGFTGLNGNSAIGISYNVETLTNNGFIRAGAGGGGGGGSGKEDSETEGRRGGGGGGGGGAGIPGGAGGVARTHGEGPFAVGQNGNVKNNEVANVNSGGSGGNGGNQGNEAFGGGGGGGGSFVTGGTGGERGDGESSEGPEPADGNTGGTNGNGGNGGRGGRTDEGERSGGGSGGQPGYSIISTNGATYNLVNNGDFRGSQINVAGNISGQF